MLILNAMKLVEPEIPIKSVAPLAATSEKSIRAAVKVDVYTHVIVDN